MSKKLAAGADAIVLDVKTGSGAFMRESKDAEALARAMVDIGNRSGRRTVALVTDMSQPLGRAVGNSMEVKEAIEVLRGERSGDLLDVSLQLAARMVGMVYPEIGEEEAGKKVSAALSSGAGLERLSCMIESQHGNPRVVDDPGLLPKASRTVPLKAKTSGYIVGMNAADIGTSALLLGAGRMKKSDTVDPAVGIWMEKRLSDSVAAGEVLGVFHVNDASRLEEAMRLFESAVTIRAEQSHAPPLIHRQVT
jgi:pyrimidine-nucleoside phosphorylase